MIEDFKRDIDAKIMKECKAMNMKMCDDGVAEVIIDKPGFLWHLVKGVPWNCIFWNTVLCLPSWGKGQSFIPIECQRCWKVVVKPRTIIELYKLLEIEKELDRPSKCGIEVRPSVNSNYGGYFYNWGIDEGRECYRIVYDACKDTMFPDIPEDQMDDYIFLKRSCTEYEHGHGPSNLWKILPGQEEYEAYMMEKIRIINHYPVHTRFQLEQVHENWVKYAFSVRDNSYLQLPEEQRNFLPPPYLKYHKEDHEYEK